MTFLREPPDSPEVAALYDADEASYGFVMNLMHLWAHRPEAHTRLFELLGLVSEDLSLRERGILVAATAASNRDSYCSTAWGWKLSEAASPDLAAAVLSGTDEGLTPPERAMARWARRVASSPGTTTEADVQELRDAGWSEDQIFEMTVFVALRSAFSAVNASLGARPDAGLTDLIPDRVHQLITWGRPADTTAVP